MVLVRSVEPGHLPDSDRLRLGLIAHFRQPFGVSARRDAAPRERCETMLERALFDWLADRGYRVTPRVTVGAWSIDLVVEGARDQRIAIECDGDRHVGAGYWLDDIRRQRVLERMGWVFWRCFATRFVMEREAVLGELESILHANGIRPGGESATDEALPTRHLLLRVEPAAAGLPAGRHDNPAPAVQPT
jgi:very-short-patch-repair endonuclease